MRLGLFFLLGALPISAQPPVDAVLRQMVPPASTSVLGIRMASLRNTDFYRRMMQQGKLPMFERFGKETGIDPRQDVRELLFVNTPSGGVLMARGTFTPLTNPVDAAARLRDAKLTRHGQYIVWSNGPGAFCYLDATLAAAGDTRSVEAALDEWTSGTHKAGTQFLDKAKSVDPASQVWGFSTTFGGFLAANLPRAVSVNGSPALDFSKIFRGLENIWFEMDFSKGFKANLHGLAATERDAENLRDTARGLVGLGRLTTPENRPELLRMWDGVTAEQRARAVAVRADVPFELLDQLVALMGTADPKGRAR